MPTAYLKARDPVDAISEFQKIRGSKFSEAAIVAAFAPRNAPVPFAGLFLPVSSEGETFYDSVTGKALFVAPKGRTVGLAEKAEAAIPEAGSWDLSREATRDASGMRLLSHAIFQVRLPFSARLWPWPGFL